MLKSASAPLKGRRDRKGRRSRSHAGEAAQSRGEGLVQSGPMPVVKVQRMTWPSGADAAAALPSGDAGPDGDATASDGARRITDAGMGEVDSLAQLSTGADAPWTGLPGCILAWSCLRFAP